MAGLGVPAIRPTAAALTIVVALAQSRATASRRPASRPQVAQPALTQRPAREPPATQPPDSAPTFRTEANYVRVDVYPTIGDGPVGDLTQNDFEVLENGVARDADTDA